MPDSTATYAPSRVFRGQDGALYLNNGAVYSSAGVNIAPFLSNIPQSSAAGVRFMGSTGKLTTGNPTTIGTGLATVLFFTAQVQSSVTPTTAGPNRLDYVVSSTAGEIHLYQYKFASTASSELIAATSSAAYSWFAIGTT